MVNGEFDIKSDEDTLKCISKVLRGTANSFIKYAMDVECNTHILDDSVSTDIDKEKCAKMLYAICKTGYGEMYIHKLTKFMEMVTDDAKRLNRGLKEEEIRKIFDNIMIDEK